MIERSIRYGFLALITALLMSCGGSGGGSDDDDGNDDGGGDPPPEESTPQLGVFDAGGNFQAEVIDASPDDLDAGESSTLTVNLVDQDENPITEAVEITFSSPCVSESRSEFDEAVVTNTSGTVEVIYTTQSCDGDDTVTATTNVDGSTLRATATITTRQAPPGSIRFEEADPQLIGIAGSGALPESSTVTFKVTNDQGGAVSGQTVNFDLTNTAGGVNLGNSSGTTDSNGFVDAIVHSGTVATTVRVEASTDTGTGTITTQSSRLSITTGVPDQDSFSLGLECMNIEGDTINGVTTTATVLLADRFNNPAPDGTAVNFTTEGGSIGGSCQTADGECTVTFTSQNPRSSDRRYTILAHATGEESFADDNGNGRFDDGEVFDDLPEAFRDDNEDDTRNTGEFFVDENGNATYDGPSGEYDGVLCEGPTDCGNESVTIRQRHVIVMSGSTAVIDINPSTIDLSSGPVTVDVSVEDTAGQRMAGGTTIEASTTHGTIVGESSVEQPCSSVPGPAVFQFVIEPEDQAGTGTFRVTVTTPVDNIATTATASVTEP